MSNSVAQETTQVEKLLLTVLKEKKTKQKISMSNRQVKT